MPLLDLPESVLGAIIALLPQQAKLNLCQASFALYKLTLPHLYQSLSLQEHVMLLDPMGFTDSLTTVISGFQNVLVSLAFNEKLMAVRQNILTNALTVNPELLNHVEEVRVSKTYTPGSEAHTSVVALLTTLSKGSNVRVVLILDQDLALQWGSVLGSSATAGSVSVFGGEALPNNATHLSLRFTRDTPELAAQLLPLLRRALGLAFGGDSNYFHTLQALNAAGPCKLDRLTIDLHHGFNGYNDELRMAVYAFLDQTLDAGALRELEVRVGCEFSYECNCMTEYLDTLAPRLTALERVSLIEKTTHKDHKHSEKWDTALLRFLIRIPAPIRYLSIRHYAPLDGNIKDGLDGNYMRRRELYENALPQLTALETLVAPTFMQSCACYEVLMSDLLWNGCQCPFCVKIQSLIDDFIMNHQYYDDEDGDFRDVITPRFFAAAGDSVAKRIVAQGSDLELMATPPCVARWDFHGYSEITCMEDYTCDFNQSAFAPLVVVLSHFMEWYIKFLMESMPGLKRVVLSGVYFDLGTEDNGTRKFRCVYDQAE